MARERIRERERERQRERCCPFEKILAERELRARQRTGRDNTEKPMEGQKECLEKMGEGKMTFTAR